MTEAVVEHDYKAKEPDELTIKKGDIITEISIKPGGWWEGTLNGGKRGMFPDNFVKLIKNEDGELLPATTGRKCKVLFAYEPLNPDELRLHVGEIIDIISEVEEGWWKGSNKHKIGVFPSNFVIEVTDIKPDVREATQRKQKNSRDESVSQTIGVNINTSESQITKSETSPDLPTLPPKPSKEYYKAMYRYDAENADELTIQPGDIITLLTKDGQDPGWWKGELKGKVGFFPDNFVELVSHEEAQKSELKTKLSNRGGAISKSATTSSICESSTSSITRKFSDSSKISEEKLPPSVSKKPVLPPPPKKLQSSIPGNKHMDSPPSSQSSKVLSNSSTTIKHSSSISESNSNSTSANNTNSTSKWTVVETSDAMDGISWSKQQSYSMKNESSTKMSSSAISSISFNSSSSSIGSGVTGNNELDLDMVGRASMLTHPTASRVKAPKRRPPSAIINLPTSFSLKEDMNNGEESPPATLVNGDAETHVEKPSNQPPWVGELKLSQAKKSMQGKTRVMIGMSTSTENVVSPPENKILATTTTASSSSTTTTSSSLVTLRQQPVIGPRPQSLMSSLKSVTNQSTDSITLSLKQWNDLLDRVASLESNFESQIVSLNKAVKDLTGKLEDETQRRQVMQQELEKLTDLVTQV